MAKTLQDLRREAGYRSAKDFAAAMEIALSTYNRYESQPESIPLKQAWAIADFLGCSIDMVVGRDPVTVDGMRGDVQRFYDSLSAEGRALMDEQMDFVAHRERKAAERRRNRATVVNRALMVHYKAQFDAQHERDAPFGIVVGYEGVADHRAAFEAFLADVAARKLEADIDEHLAGLEEELREGYIDADGTAHSFSEDEIARQLETERAAMREEYEPRDREVIAGIMQAYDEQSEGERHEWLTFIGRS